QLISDVVFHPFKISIDNLSVLIIKLGISDDDSDNFIGYQSRLVANYSDISPNEVWKKVGILKNYSRKILFGINHQDTIDTLENYVE
ncbi:15002_t:CDS:2, partial [Funneliformis caledonium]